MNMNANNNTMRVWINGTFDVLHVGHIKLLEYASGMGSLVVGIDSDKRVKELKGQDRPFNTAEDRKEMLLALKYVDSVKIFDSREEMIEMIKEWDPHYMVVGDDYKDKEVIGSEWAKQLIFYTKVKGHSTTKILNYVKDISNR